MFASHQNAQPIPLPYTSKLGQPLQAGQTIKICGSANENANRTEVNLLQGGTEIGGNVQAILHINLRFDEGKIVMNSFTGGNWGKEERESLPIKKGQKFDLRIRVLDEAFEISVDGKKIHDYKHRTPFQQAEYIQVKGDVTLFGVHWGGRFYSIPWETGFQEGHLTAGHRIHVYAIPKGDRWNLDLIARNGDVLFHLNPRFKEKAVVRNSCRNGVWEKEEREGPFPFEKNRGFDLLIVNEPYSIQMFVNGDRLGTFQHRTPNPVGDYIGMRIDGEIDVTNIAFNE